MVRTLGAAGLALVLCGCGAASATDGAPADSAAEPSVTSEDPVIVLDESSRRGEARVGDRIEVRLKAQFGSGYSWALPVHPETLRSLGETTGTDNSDVEGGWDVQVFAFEATAPGEARLEFAYRRPWEAAKPPKKTAVFEVTIAAQ